MPGIGDKRYSDQDYQKWKIGKRAIDLQGLIDSESLPASGPERNNARQDDAGFQEARIDSLRRRTINVPKPKDIKNGGEIISPPKGWQHGR